jgi:hypothetical protein
VQGSNGDFSQANNRENVRWIVSPRAPWGDCNHDDKVDAGDITALGLEVFDEDGNVPRTVPGGTFLGNPTGCNANQDTLVDAGDVMCTVRIAFGDDCTAATTAQTHASTEEPEVFVPSLNVRPGTRITVPISYLAQGHDIGSLIFSLTYDPQRLAFDSTDADADGVPDTVRLNVPEAWQAMVAADREESHGKLDFFIGDLAPPLDALPDGVLAYVAFDVVSTTQAVETWLRFSDDPPISFGDTAGHSVPGSARDGALLITQRPADSPHQLYLPLVLQQGGRRE